MDPELKALIDSPEFHAYDTALRPRAFNPFDVLQVADVEIRHSNVLAWLLAPDGTHGIGGRFLRALVEHLMPRPEAASLQRLSGFDDKDNVEIRREDYHEGGYADITVGFKAEKVLLVIETKVVGWYAGAENQTKGYQETLGKKYKDRYDHYPGVLLTTSNSPEERNAEPERHYGSSPLFLLSWDEMRRIIRPLLDDFPDDVRDFVKQYLDIIEEKLIHTGDDLAEQLRKNHRRIFEKLKKERALLDEVDELRRATITRWMAYFEERPHRLREKVAEYVQKRGVGAGIERTAGRGAWKHLRWLYWWATPCGEELGIHEVCCWRFSFGRRKVTVSLRAPWRPDPENGNWQRIWSFLQDVPIDPARPKRYPMESENRVIYLHDLLRDAELAGTLAESVELLQYRLDEFFGPDGDYERIKRYFSCLAYVPHRPGVAEDPPASE